MRPQSALRAAYQEALAVGRGQSYGRAVSTPFHNAAHRSAPSLLQPRPVSAAVTRAIAATPTQFYSTSTPISSTTPSSSSSSSSSEPIGPPAPVLPSSVLSEILFPSSSPSSPSAAVVASNHPSVYATVHIHGRPYLVTPGDSLRLPFRMPGVRPGDELRLDRVGVVGNRTVTAVSASEDGSQQAHVPGASVRAVVLGVETEPLRVMVKTKRRNRRNRTVKSKHHFTVLRIQEVVVEE